MRGGSNIKSVSEKRAAGTSEPHRDKMRVENFSTTVSTLNPPSHFSKRQVEKWIWVCEKLAEKNLLTESDSDAIQIYVESWVIYEDCVADVKENGTVLWAETAAGKKPMTNPAYRHMKDCETTLRMLWDHFAMTPRARMGVKVTEKPKTSRILELINGGKTKTA